MTSRHLLPKTLTAPSLNSHNWDLAPVQPCKVTAAPSELEAAVIHLASMRIGHAVSLIVGMYSYFCGHTVGEDILK